MKKKKIVFLILPNVHLLDLAGPDQVFFTAMGYDAPLTMEYCSTSSSVSSSADLPFGKLKYYTKVKLTEGDFLVIPGANLSYLCSREFRSDKNLFEWIRNCYSSGINICSICSGSFVLAESGILDNKNCTTHWKRAKDLQQMYPLTKVQENVLFTDDSGIYTSAGIASGIDLALYIIEKLYGEYFAHKIARELVIYNRRKGTQNQQSELINYRNHIHSGIHRVQDWLQENLHKKTSVGDLAEIASMSERNFTRIFKKETSLTVNGYITILRREKITGLLSIPDITRNQIAKQCGLKSERHINRILNMKTG